MKLCGLKIDVLLPDRACLQMAAHTLNGAFEYLLNLFISIGAQVLVLVLKELQVAVP